MKAGYIMSKQAIFLLLRKNGPINLSAPRESRDFVQIGFAIVIYPSCKKVMQFSLQQRSHEIPYIQRYN